MNRLLAALVVTWGLLTPGLAAHAQRIISHDGGGNLYTYIEKYTEMNKQGGEIRVEGLCASACTLLLGLVYKPTVCATPNALFGFHSAYTEGEGPAVGERIYAPEATALAWSLYPQKVRDKLQELGWDGGERKDMLWVKATEFLPSCEKVEHLVAASTTPTVRVE